MAEAIGDIVTINLGGKDRELRYDFRQTLKIKKQFKFRDYDDLINKADLLPEEYLPATLMEGVLDKEGLTVEAIEMELIGPRLDEAQRAFCIAFFPPRIRALLELVERNREAAMEALDAQKRKEAEKVALAMTASQ